jgi:predicted PurR-regulated permease PerM
MADEMAKSSLSTESTLTTPSTEGGQAGRAAAASEVERKTIGSEEGSEMVRNAPTAMRRSMPMALSITLGLLLAVALGLFLYKLTWFLLIFYLSFVAATILEAPVYWLTRRGLWRGFSAMIVMVGGLLVIAGVLFLIGNGVASQAAAVSKNLQDAPRKINDFVTHTSERYPRLGERLKEFNVGNALAAAAPSLTSVVTNTMAGIEAVSWLVITFFLVLYMLVDGPSHLRTLRALLPQHVRLDATRLFLAISKAHRGWGLASVANVASSSILVGTGLFLLGVPGALILGFFAGLGELIPNIGPLVAALPALLMAVVATPDQFLYVLGMFVVVWTVQGYTISPLMMKFSVELPVLVTIMAVLIFGTLFGFLGILASVPLVADLVVIWHFHASRWEKDCTDYDTVNTAPADQGRRM